MASSTSVPAASLCSTRGLSLRTLTRRPLRTTSLTTRRSSLKTRICAELADKTELKYNKVGDSDLVISEITYGTMTFGEQNTEKEPGTPVMKHCPKSVPFSSFSLS